MLIVRHDGQHRETTEDFVVSNRSLVVLENATRFVYVIGSLGLDTSGDVYYILWNLMLCNQFTPPQHWNK